MAIRKFRIKYGAHTVISLGKLSILKPMYQEDIFSQSLSLGTLSEASQQMLHKYLTHEGSVEQGYPNSAEQPQGALHLERQQIFTLPYYICEESNFQGNDDKAYTFNEVPVCSYLLEAEMPSAWQVQQSCLSNSNEALSGDQVGHTWQEAGWFQEKVSARCAKKSPGTSCIRINQGYSLPVLFCSKVLRVIFLWFHTT